MASNKRTPSNNTIAQNKRVHHDYFISDKVEAGLALQGWEVKSIRAGKAQLTDTHVFFKNSEAWLLNAEISPIGSVSTHHITESRRQRKLLLHRREINKLRSATEQKGYTVVCTAMYWKQHMVKVEIALAKGKQSHDKRDTEKQRDWDRQKQRIMRRR